MKIRKIKKLEFAVNTAIKNNQSLMLFIEMPGFECPEIIINPPENLVKKLEYYKNTYDDELEHKHSKGIKIIAYKLI
ncbi:MAG: hypothetical protein K0S76_440 [Herbinix sp.]|jgi:hypothetical protein|nr:hypothetical protein [Herbinix sp.]